MATTRARCRSRRTLELVKAAEINDGEEMPLEKRPTQTHQYRVRRWPGPGKQTHHGRAHRKLRVRDKKKTMPVVKQHRVMRIRRAEKAEEHNKSNYYMLICKILSISSLKENEEKKHQTQMKKELSSSQSQEKKQRRARSLVTRELVPKGYPPYETQSEETMERDKTLKSLYPSQFF
ncbi:hypothetical protein TELCIR_09403 [Teladorsagia circumcincta]|uniref:Uncharacterized protein n=1 Tax=Teladorsagia circumcincta TaxID=45464 RepID=A0A2G9UEX0_TELCI|nr:hypothetical protein TELCIR_09403 [Teladorsagia circumcincta]